MTQPSSLTWILLYVIETLPLFVIAYRCEHSLPWLAFIPFANLWLMCDMADLSLAWILILLLPYIGAIAFTIIVWTRLAENTNKSPWLGLLMWIPLVNLLAGYYIALMDTGKFRG